MNPIQVKGVPPFFFNTIPKSGTNLLMQILEGIPGAFFRSEKFLYFGTPEQIEDHSRFLKSLSKNQFGGGHISFSSEWNNMFQQLAMKQIFLIRDPRDIVVSYTYYLDEIPNDYIAQYAKKNNLSQKQIYFAIIEGFTLPLGIRPNIKDFILEFAKWRNASNVLTLTYEELVKSPLSQHSAIEKIVNFLLIHQKTGIPRNTIVSSMVKNINPQKSGTFRKGKIGGWRNEFDNEVKRRFKDVAGDLLIDLGYEKDLNW